MLPSVLCFETFLLLHLYLLIMWDIITKDLVPVPWVILSLSFSCQISKLTLFVVLHRRS